MSLNFYPIFYHFATEACLCCIFDLDETTPTLNSKRFSVHVRQQHNPPESETEISSVNRAVNGTPTEASSRLGKIIELNVRPTKFGLGFDSERGPEKKLVGVGESFERTNQVAFFRRN